MRGAKDLEVDIALVFDVDHKRLDALMFNCGI